MYIYVCVCWRGGGGVQPCTNGGRSSQQIRVSAVGRRNALLCVYTKDTHMSVDAVLVGLARTIYIHTV